MLWAAAFALLTALAPAEPMAQSEYEALAAEFDASKKAYVEAYQAAKTDEQFAATEALRPQPQKFAPRFFALAEKHQGQEAAASALVWIASHLMFAEEGERALKLLADKYSTSGPVIAYVSEPFRCGEPFAAYEVLLRAVLKNNPQRNVQAAACLSLATYLKMAKEKSESNLIRIKLDGRRAPWPTSLANLEALQERGLDRVATESEALFERVIEQYSDFRLANTYPPEAGKFAREQLFALRHLAIGSPAIEIEAQDVSGRPLKLSDYRGQVVVLDFGSHRTCGICRAIYPDLRSLVNEFQGKPAVLIGINCCDNLAELKHLTEQQEITWPVVWDSEDIGPITTRWAIQSMPTLYVVDHKGIIRNKGVRPEDIRGTVEMLLEEMAAEQ